MCFTSLLKTILFPHTYSSTSFDSHFNAITGLNGSGKSNILDAICFVLGITNLSQVRAGNLAELVYKQGQAGVNKATVTLVLDNSHSSSPVGYESCPTITVTRQVLLGGGKSKYLINGKTAPAASVQNLFRSVALNVNNPHFLILQGRITKVLNMRSHEILGLVEEAAGTKLYQDRRQGALQTLAKKQLKLDEIQRVLEEDITPTLERLRGEKQNYLKWSKNGADVERLERYCVAYQYYSMVQQLGGDANNTVDAIQEEIAECEQRQCEYREKIQAIQDQMDTALGKLQSNDGTLAQAKKLEKERSNVLVRESSKWTLSKNTVEQAQKDLQAAQALADETKTQQAELDLTAETRLPAAQASLQQAQEQLAALEKEYTNMVAGLQVEDRSLPEQMSQAQSDAKSAQAKVEQANLKVQHLTKELKVRMEAPWIGHVLFHNVVCMSHLPVSSCLRLRLWKRKSKRKDARLKLWQKRRIRPWAKFQN